MSNARFVAATALKKVTDEGGYSNLVLNNTLNQFALADEDKSLCTAIFYGTLDRLVTIDFYLKKTTDLLLDQSKAPSTGVTSAKQNIGEIENKGFEFQADGYIIQNRDFFWQLGASGSINRNKILKINCVHSFSTDFMICNKKIIGWQVNSLYQCTGTKQCFY